MAAYYCYRHVELDNIGNGKKRFHKSSSSELRYLFTYETFQKPSTIPMDDSGTLKSINNTILTEFSSSPAPSDSNCCSRHSSSDVLRSPFSPKVQSKRNPITGEGCEEVPLKSAVATRVPPGGYSSKLW